MLYWRDNEIYEITVGFSPLALYLGIRHDSNAMRAPRVQPMACPHAACLGFTTSGSRTGIREPLDD